MRYFHCLNHHVPIQSILAEITLQPDAWLIETSRQRKLKVQKETQSIPLRKADKEHPKAADVEVCDNHYSCDTHLAARFPVVMRWLKDFAAARRADLARCMLVKLAPYSQVYKHYDHGEYYRIRDRYHLVIDSPSGSPLCSGNETVVMQTGELWWFDNKAEHEAFNLGQDPRIHLIFDVLPLEGYVPPRAQSALASDTVPRGSL